MKINRSDNPDYSLSRNWLRRQVYESKEFRAWMYNKVIKILKK